MERPATQTSEVLVSSPHEFTARALELISKWRQPDSTVRRLIGVCGGPGSGKSTLTYSLAVAATRRGISTVVVPMDGFHLSNAVLTRLGRAERKGAADTFDVDGFVHLLQRIRTEPATTIYAPVFHRDVEESYAAELVIEPAIELVLVEGIHLLQTAHGWDRVLPLLDAAWYLECVDAKEQAHRLVQRNITHGRTEQQALDWVTTVDLPNLAQIEATKHQAQTVFKLAAW